MFLKEGEKQVDQPYKRVSCEKFFNEEQAGIRHVEQVSGKKDYNVCMGHGIRHANLTHQRFGTLKNMMVKFMRWVV